MPPFDTPTPTQLTEKDLDPAADPAGEKKTDDSAAKDAPDPAAADDKGAKANGDDKARSDKQTDGSVFADLDDDDEAEGEEKGKQGKAKDEDKSDKAAVDDKDKADDKAETKEAKQERERLAADAQWRDRMADRAIASLKGKISDDKLAKRREGILAQLKRYKSQDEATWAGFQAQEKIRSGDHKKMPEEEAAQAAWRKEMGIPDKPEDYGIPKVAGHEWTDADQPVIDSFRTAAHAANLTQEQANKLVDWKIKDDQANNAAYEEQLATTDKEDRIKCHDALRAEFGAQEFRPHMAVMKRLVEDAEVFGEGTAAKLAAARYYDVETGKWHRLTSDPNVARGLIGLALDRYGEAGLPATEGRAGSTADRLTEINKIMATDYQRYVREGLADEAMKLVQQQEDRAAKRKR